MKPTQEDLYGQKKKKELNINHTVNPKMGVVNDFNLSL